MRIVISALRDGKYERIHESEHDCKYIDFATKKWEPKPQEYEVQIIAKSPVRDFIVGPDYLHLFFRTAKPKFQIIEPKVAENVKRVSIADVPQSVEVPA